MKNLQKTDSALSDLEQRNVNSIEFLNHIRQDNKKMHNQLAQIVEEYERERHFAKMMETARKSQQNKDEMFSPETSTYEILPPQQRQSKKLDPKALGLSSSIDAAGMGSKGKLLS
jgi:hypothetical protein